MIGRRTGVVAAGIGLLAASAGALLTSGTRARDAELGESVRRAGGHRTADRVAVATTDLGSLYAVLGAAGTLGVARRPHAAADLVAVGAGAWVVSQTAKRLTHRERPYEAEGTRRLIACPTGSSFPSGHAAVAAAVAGVVAPRVRPPLAPAVAALPAWVGWTRVHVGVHYPSDVVGGAGLGLVLAAGWLRLRRGSARRA